MGKGMKVTQNEHWRSTTNYEWRGGLGEAELLRPPCAPSPPLLNLLFFNSPLSPPTGPTPFIPCFCSKLLRMLCALFHVCSCDVSLLWLLRVLTSSHSWHEFFDDGNFNVLLNAVHCLFERHNKSPSWLWMCVQFGWSRLCWNCQKFLTYFQVLVAIIRKTKHWLKQHVECIWLRRSEVQMSSFTVHQPLFHILSKT